MKLVVKKYIKIEPIRRGYYNKLITFYIIETTQETITSRSIINNDYNETKTRSENRRAYKLPRQLTAAERARGNRGSQRELLYNI